MHGEFPILQHCAELSVLAIHTLLTTVSIFNTCYQIIVRAAEKQSYSKSALVTK